MADAADPYGGILMVAILRNPIPNAEHFGIAALENTGSATVSGDYAAAIQAMYDEIAARGGGDLILPAGDIPIGSRLYFGEGPPIMVRGAGRGGAFGNNKIAFRSSAGTRLVWTGAQGGTMIELTSNRADDGSTDRMAGGGIVDLMLDGVETAAYGLRVYSHAESTLRITTAYCNVNHVSSGILSNGVLPSSVADVQDFDWDIRAAEITPTQEAVALVRFDGDPDQSANTSHGRMLLRLKPEASAVAAHFCAVDGCDITIRAATRATASGDGGMVFLHADDTGPGNGARIGGGHCRDNIFGFAECKQGLVAKATIAGTQSSVRNMVLASRGNGAPAPVAEPGAEIWYSDTLGNTNLT